MEKVEVQASRVFSLPARQESTSSDFPFQRLTLKSHTQVTGSPTSTCPPSSPTHLSTGTLPALQGHHGPEKVFILFADHDGYMAVVHHLLYVKDLFMPHAGQGKVLSNRVSLG